MASAGDRTGTVSEAGRYIVDMTVDISVGRALLC